MMTSQTQSSYSSQTSLQPQQRCFTGRVTKLLDNFGFIDDDVFFQLNCVKGGQLKIGDQVYVECQYSEALPFKWNAVKVQLTPQPQNTISSTYLPQRLLQQPSRETPTQQSYFAPKDIQQQTSHQFAPSTQQSISGFAQKTEQQNYNDYPSQQLYYNRQEYSSPQFNQNQITYTSTPGSAFVSNQLLPFTQQPTIHHQPQQPKKQQQGPQQGRQFSGHSNKGISRWDEPKNENNRSRRDDKIRNEDRDRERYNRNRSREKEGDKFNEKERERFPEKERNKNQEKEKDKTPREQREKEQKPVRNTESPVSTTSSQVVANSTRQQRRRYDPVNVPKCVVLKSPLNLSDIKQRYGNGLHVPSDLKEVCVNDTFELNIKDIPKPIVYRIIDEKENSDSTSEVAPKEKSHDKMETDGVKKELPSDLSSKEKSIPEKVVKIEEPSSVNVTTKEPKLRNKYGVKVVLLSLISMSDIYDRVFGSDNDLVFNSTKAYFLHFNKLVSFLCGRHYNEGHTLIGGKFDSKLDGFIPGTNEPNLIATAIRCVQQHTEIDLTKCKRWKHIATFVYNRDDSPNPDCSLEYCHIYLPDVWSVIDDKHVGGNESTSEELAKNVEKAAVDNIKFNANETNNKSPDKCISLSNDKSNANEEKNLSDQLVDQPVDMSSPSFPPSDTSEHLTIHETTLDSDVGGDKSNLSSNEVAVDKDLNPLADSDSQRTQKDVDDSFSDSVKMVSASEEASHVHEETTHLMQRLNDLKVAELKVELEKRGLKIKSNIKKADLIVKLKDLLIKELDDDLVSDSVKENWWAKRILSKEEKKEENSESELDSIDAPKIEESVTDDDQCPPESQQVDVKESSVDATAGSDLIAESKPAKRKLDDDVKLSPKRSKTENSNDKTKTTAKLSDKRCIVAHGTQNLTVISLHQALNHQKYDHFELSLVAELFKESLIRHFAHYIYSALIHNYNIKKQPKETNSECLEDIKGNNYLQLAFSYFDSCHCGFVLAEDVTKLLHNCNFSVSKKVLGSILGNDDRLYYKNLVEPTDLINLNKSSPFQLEKKQSSQSQTTAPVFVKDGNIYNINELIRQSEEDEKVKIELNEKIKSLLNNHEYEMRQKKLNARIEKQNNEISSLKKENESFKVKIQLTRKSVESNMSSFSDLLKKLKDDN